MEANPETTRRLRRRRRAALAVLALVALASVVALWSLPPETASRLKAIAVGAMERTRELGPGWFFAAFAILPAIGFPVSPFALGAGSLFGPVLGLPAVLVLAVLCMAVSMTISYVLASRVLRPWVARLLAYLGYQVPVVPDAKQRMFVFIVRITPGSPYVFQSFLLGLAGVRFRVYLAVSWLVAASTMPLMIVFGDALMKGKGRVAFAALFGAVLAGVGIRLLRRRLAAREESVLAAAARAEGRAGDGA